VVQGIDKSRKQSGSRNENGRFLSGVFEGLINKEIAERIGVSESSVKATLQQLFSKTGVRTRSQLVRITRKRLTNTPVRQAGSVLKSRDDRKNRVVSTQATYTSGCSAVGG
jgi:transposase